MSDKRVPGNKKATIIKNELLQRTLLTNKLDIIEKKLCEYLDANPIDDESVPVDPNSKYTVFIAVSDGMSRAHVCHSTNAEFSGAWTSVCTKAIKMVEDFNIKATWVKVDLVNKVQKIPYAAMPKIFLSAKYQKFFRMGFSLDEKMEYAFTEAEANSYKLYDYTVIPMKASKPGHEKVPCINIPQVIHYLQFNRQPVMNILGSDVWVFNCKCFFADENKEVFELYDRGMHCGRRIVENVDKDIVKSILETSSQFLINQIKADGSFVYGYYPSFDSVMSSYNILRHAGTLWSMMCANDVVKNENIKPAVASALDYLVTQIKYLNDNTAFIVEAKASEIKLGGLGITIIAMSKYMEIYGDRDYTDIIRKLAEGIIYMQNQETGKLLHVLNSDDYSVKEEMRTVYYDGESSYALVKAYEITKDSKYLDAAALSIDYFMRENYIKYRDHWLAYAMNEFTKHVPEEKYLTFALKNAWENRKRINEQQTSYHTYLELLMETYDIYLRIKKNNLDVPYMKKIDEEEFRDIIRHRAWHMLDGYFYPEYAMYMSKPNKILGSFFVRHDGFRTRIDDDQHFMDGYAKYYKLMFT